MKTLLALLALTATATAEVINYSGTQESVQISYFTETFLPHRSTWTLYDYDFDFDTDTKLITLNDLSLYEVGSSDTVGLQFTAPPATMVPWQIPHADATHDGWHFNMIGTDSLGNVSGVGVWLEYETETFIHVSTSTTPVVLDPANPDRRYWRLPNLPLTFVPEPGTLALAGMALIALVRRPYSAVYSNV